jgi:hypothetical protein
MGAIPVVNLADTESPDLALRAGREGLLRGYTLPCFAPPRPECDLSVLRDIGLVS